MSTEATNTALDRLVEAISSPLDRNDLGRLARMHSFCQALAETKEPGDEGARQAVQNLAGSLVALLEKLILDEAAHADEGLSLIPEAVGLIQQACQGESVAVQGVVTRIQAASTGEAVAARAPAVGESSPPTAEQPAEPAEAAAPEAVEPAPSTAVQEVPQPAAPPAVDARQATAPPAAAAAPPPGAPEPPPAPMDGADGPYVSEPLVIDLAEREHLVGFIEEGREHMEAIEAALLLVEQDPTNADQINELFRPFHTIKGIAGFLNLRDINQLTHEVETILDLGRRNELRITSGTVDRIFAAVDLLKVQISEVQSFLASPRGEVCPQPDIAGMITQLRAVGRGRSAELEEGTAPSPKLGEVLVANEAAIPEEVEEALEIQSGAPPPAPKLGEILVDRGAVSNKQVDSALSQQTTGKVGAEQTLRVETAKLDTLVEAVGELVIAQTMVNLSESISGSSDVTLIRNVSQVTKIVRDVQETAMGLRMVPVGPAFQKMKRLVRDVSRRAEKSVELHVSGEDTELDKTVIQQISDPLMHMIRNAVDHGIELPAARRQAGKPETGHVYLDAYHQGDSILIEICDDGAGMDSEKLIAKGIERGLVGPEDQLSERQAFALVLQPGFSMAEQVTDISGRGVGMDVVKRNIEQLRGKVEIQSEKGQGTTFLIRLPLTLAIIDGMLVQVGQERLIIPTILIEQSLRPQRSQITTVQQRGEMLQVRGELCPLIQLGQLFRYSGRRDPSKAIVVIAHCEGQKVGLVVDELIGQQQVVIKSLTDNFKQVKGVSGAAILGDGRVGLILEPTGLLQMYNQCRHQGTLLACRSSEDAATPEVSVSEEKQERSTSSEAAGCAETAAAVT